jgi:hypothetical protein
MMSESRRPASFPTRSLRTGAMLSRRTTPSIGLAIGTVTRRFGDAPVVSIGAVMTHLLACHVLRRTVPPLRCPSHACTHRAPS